MIALVFTTAYSLLQMIMVATIFTLLANGYDFFGALSNKGLKILGDISYSIYLIHGIVLYLIFTQFHLFDFSKDLAEYYLYFPLIFMTVVLSSLITYLLIEKRWM